MSWRDGRDSCTCSCTLTGLPAQIPTELRRGSANKTQTVILEVPTCLTPHILTSSPRPTNSNNNYNLLLLLLLFTTTTTTITHFCRVVYHPSDKLNISNSVSLRTDTTSPLSLSLFLSHSHSLSLFLCHLPTRIQLYRRNSYNLILEISWNRSCLCCRWTWSLSDRSTTRTL